MKPHREENVQFSANDISAQRLVTLAIDFINNATLLTSEFIHK
ncbi:hypothetical protein [Atopobium sp. oral taxon 416]|jgi:hypothetical protein|nr:hypothetical protein [Atopobium sp. oral taxon 416]